MQIDGFVQAEVRRRGPKTLLPLNGVSFILKQCGR